MAASEGTSGDSDSSSVVSGECLFELFEHCFKTPYKATSADRKVDIIQKRCLHLLGNDYQVREISNKNGAISNYYPVEIYVPLAQVSDKDFELTFLAETNFNKLRDLMISCRLARCRQRFVVPVMCFGNKYICRSATLASTAEMIGRSGMEWIGLFSTEEPQSRPEDNSNGDILTTQRSQDIKLLKYLRVSLICDLMVENKMIKFGVPVTSSEKVDKGHRYHNDFNLVSMPYPGCEFFKEYRENEHLAQGLRYNWSQPMVDADFNIPPALCHCDLNITWENYQSWDLVKLTQNYMKFLIQSVALGEGGLLIHCVSGWDRTPLFVSLLRLSLWADGKVHKSLCAAEMLYFTIAYDWLLFGHQFIERLNKGEAIFAFCFDFLQYITSDEYSMCNFSSRIRSGMLFQTDSDLKLDEVTGDTSSRIQESPIDNEMLHGGSPSSGPAYKKSCSYPTSQPLSVNSDPSDLNYSTSYGSWQVVHSGDSLGESDAHADSSMQTDTDTSTTQESSRCNKLRNIRSTFWGLYGQFLDETNPTSSARSLTGFFSKLATSVGMGST